ncbi:MAG: prephenate dehydrogenase [Butyrivibrio sp.]|nr:prephenate dehydrogenase [Butyrivibrio sp.]
MLNIGFIGLGLIGGSIAKSLKKSDSSIYITAYNRSPKPLEDASADGVIDRAAHEVDSAFSDCDIIFLCTPVEHNSTYLSLLKGIIKKGCIITDVGSVKGYIHDTVKSLDMEDCFIGGHPMAGSEKTGYSASTDTMLENAYYAITPTPLTTEEALDFYVGLVKKTGAVPVVVEPDKHDYAVAGISHVPHLIASGLVNTVSENDTDDCLMKMLAAGGFKDITRIASSSADMWSQICMTNSAQISLLLGKYIDYLTSVKAYVDSRDRDSVAEMFVRSKEYRDSINIRNSGPLPQSHTLYCDIEDKEGALNDITGLLSARRISIKNIEIIHNREYRDGVLLIDFYDRGSLESALSILTENGHSVHK